MIGVVPKKLIKSFLVFMSAVFLLLVPAGAFPVSADASIVQVKVTPEYKQTVARGQLSMLNSWRAGSNWYYNSSNSKVYIQPLKALKYDYTLEKYAMQRAAEIAVSFDHLRPKGDKKHGLSGYAVGENILASSRPDAATAQYAFTQFKEEDKNYSLQGHRRNMLSVPCAYDAVGIACIYYKGYYFWVQEFGKVSKPDTTATTAVNGTKTMTVDIETNDVYDSKADLTELNSWDAILKKGETDYLPQVGLEVKMFDTVGKNGYAEVVAVPTWSSSNSGVATVNSNAGTITGVSTGSSNITMKESITNTTKSKTVSVTDPNAVTGVSLNNTTLKLNTGASSTLKATVTPSTASNKNVTWSSSNTAVATVSSAGVVKGVKAGTATITVKTASGGKTATCKVTVSDIVPTSVKLNKTSATFRVGQTTSLTATVSPTNATNKNVNWSSSNTAVAKVSSSGVVTGVKAGTATITAKTVSGGKTATCKVTIEPMLKGMIKDSDGVWRYYDNNAVATGFTGMVKKDSEYWYVKNGVFQDSYYGLVYYDGRWWYVRAGVENKEYKGLTWYNEAWWYVSNGTLDKAYDGLTQYNGSWWYIKNGTIAKGFTGIVLYNGNNWYVKNGMVDKSYTGLTWFNDEWWYVSNGYVSVTFKGLVYCNNGWWYVTDGHINRTYNNIVFANGTWWYIKNGTIDKSFTGIVSYNGNYWYVEKGQLAKGYSGTVTYNGDSYNVEDGYAVKI